MPPCCTAWPTTMRLTPSLASTPSSCAHASGRDVARVVRCIRQLVIAEQIDPRTARGVRVGRQLVGQLEDLRFVIAAIEDVAGRNDEELAADPFVGLVDRPRRAQGRARSTEIAVQIADRDDPMWVAWHLRRHGRQRARLCRFARRWLIRPRWRWRLMMSA